MIHRLLLVLAITCLSAASMLAQTGPGIAPSNNDIVRFDRHVQPLLSKLGCNAGACHGNSAGKGGLKLSLFGADSKMDFLAFTDESSARIDRMDPSQSLVLQKTAEIVEHGGGKRFEVDSMEYETVRRWIELGAVDIEKPDPIRELEITPATCKLKQNEPKNSFQVFATFHSGEKLDVTAWSTLRVANDSIADISKETIRRLQPGKTSLIASYAGWSANAAIIVPREAVSSIASSRSTPTGNNLVDPLIDKQLAELGVDPAPTCDDTTFLRRLRLVTLGSPPDIDSIKRFGSDTDPQKREKAIDECLASPIHASVLATRMCEILGSRDMGNLPIPPDQNIEAKWHAWFQSRFERNERYDVVVRQIFCATTRDQHSAADYVDEAILSHEKGQQNDPSHYARKASLDLFWQRWKVNEEVDSEALAERVSAAFLGVRIDCSKCHKHPFERWTQDDYRSFANIFTQVRLGMSGELRIALSDKLQQQRELSSSDAPKKVIPPMREVYLSAKPVDFRKTNDNSLLPPKPLTGEPLPSDGDRRATFVDWLLDRSNPYFARNFVNRIWGMYLGPGWRNRWMRSRLPIRRPMPNYSMFLRAILSKAVMTFDDSKRTILSTHSWQRSSYAGGESVAGNELYARFPVRILPASAIVDSLANALREEAAPAASLPTVAAGNESQQPYFDVFSRPERTSRCDCERSDQPTLRRAMLLLSDEELSKRIDKFVGKWIGGMESIEDCASDRRVSELFLSVLARWPNPAELRVAKEYFTNTSDRHRAAADILWSLINTSEFVTLH